MSLKKFKPKGRIKIIKEPAQKELYCCNSEKLSEHFVARQIDDYCVSTQGVMPN